MAPSQYFPHVNIPALQSWAASVMTNMHPPPSSSRHGVRQAGKLQPKVACEDIIWAGEKMILITFERATAPLGPPAMLAHFPRGRRGLATQALVGMTATVRQSGTVSAPQIYAFFDYLPNPVGAEVVLMEKIPGYSLLELWPRLTTRQIYKVCVAVAEILVGLFNNRGSLICTDLFGTDVNTRPAIPGQPAPPSRQKAVLLTAPFDQGPLIGLSPQPALRSTKDYFQALADRVHRAFPITPAGEPTPLNLASRRTGWALKPQLDDEDIERLKWSWASWHRLAPYHMGGYYLPKAFSDKARQIASSFLSCNQFGIRHPDMRMARFIIQFHSRESRMGNVEQRISVTLTGWEHAHRAPLWSCARWPAWMNPRQEMNEYVSEGQKVWLRRIMASILNDNTLLPDSWQFVVAHAFGATERWYEDCLSSHWLTRNPLEICLYNLKQRWEQEQSGIEFPLAIPSQVSQRWRVPKSRDGVSESDAGGGSSGEADAPPRVNDLD